MECARPPPLLPHQPVTLGAPFPAGFAYRPRPVPPWDHARGQSLCFPQKDPQLGGEGHFGGPIRRNPVSHHPIFSSLGLTGQQRAPWPIPGSPRTSPGSPVKKVVTNPPGNAGDAREVLSIPRWGRPRGGGILGQRSLRAAVRGVAKSRTERAYTYTHTHTHTHVGLSTRARAHTHPSDQLV